MKDGDKIMKKILSAIIMTAVAVSLCACSSQNAQQMAPSEENSTVTESSAAGGGNITGNGGDSSQYSEESSVYSDSAETETFSNSDSQTSNSVSPKLRSSSASTGSANAKVSDSLDKAVSDAILDYNNGSYQEGESEAEGHLILDVVNENSNVKVYALTMYGEYSFINDMFIKISGTGAIPVVMSFQEDKDNSYTLINYQEPEDGSKYVTSVKELFPQNLYSRIVPVSDNDRTALSANERRAAKKYLDSIERSASIGDYSDITLEYPKVSDEIVKTVFDRYWEYPDWLGTTEKIENNVRYVYETQWKNYGNNDSMIYLTKYVYDTGEIIRTVNIHIDNGQIQSSEEKVLKLIGNSSNSK